MRRPAALVLTIPLLFGACGGDDDGDLDALPASTAASDDGFDTLDGNGDSYLDGDEVAEWVDDVGLFDEWDIDADSALDLDEIAERWDRSVLGESWSGENLDEETFRDAYFDLYDTDGDGKISDAEWDRGERVYGTPAE